MSLRAHIVADSDPQYLSVLKAELSNDIEITVSGSIPSNSPAETMIAGVPTRADLEAAKDLTSLIIPWTGLPRPTAALLKDFPHLRVYNIHHNASATAEMALALALSAAKNISPIDRKLRSGDWRPRYSPSANVSLSGKNTLVLGFGHIGRRIARMARGLEMSVTAVSRTGVSNEETVSLYPLDKMRTLLPETNVLFVIVPYTDDTHGLIGADELSLLPDNAVVVNVARGKVIDERALFEELKSGRLRAGIDVWYRYPKKPEEYEHTEPSHFPFHTLDNVVMTPHIGGDTMEIESLRGKALAELLNAIASGATISNEVDLRLGY